MLRLRLNGVANIYDVHNQGSDLDLNPLLRNDSIYYLADDNNLGLAGYAGKQAGLSAYWNTPGVAAGRNPWTGLVPPNGRADWRVGTVLGIANHSVENLQLGECIVNQIDALNTSSALHTLGLIERNFSDDQKHFQDEDGLISFVNLSSSFVTSNKEYKTGRAVCDKVSNYFATLREKCFTYLKKNPDKVPAGDELPKTIWSPAVTHLMQFLLKQTGGLTNFKIMDENFSRSMTNTEFSSEFIKTLFDTAIVPASIITSAQKFIAGVGESIRINWDKKERNYETAVLSQCHEAVPLDSQGKDYVYFPKIKYIYISISSEQTEFTSPCVDLKKISFNFKYQYYVTGLSADVLNENSKLYKDFTAFLDKAQGISYKDASNTMDDILDASSDKSKTYMSVDAKSKISEEEAIGIDLTQYPKVQINPPSPVEKIINSIRTTL